MKTFRLYFFFLLSLVAGLRPLFSQNQHFLDSVLNVADRATNDSVKSSAYDLLRLSTQNSAPFLAKYYADKALKYAPKNHPEFRASVLLAKAGILRSLGELDSCVNLINIALEISNRINNKATLSKCYFELGQTSQTQNNLDKALEFYTKCLSIQKLAHIDAEIPGTLNNIGIVYGTKQNWTKALEYFSKALADDLQRNNISALGNEYNNLGIVFIINEKYDSAMIYLKKGLEYRKRVNNLLGIGGSYNNLALLQKRLNNPKKGLVYVDSALRIAKQIGSKKLELEVYGSYHELYAAMEDFESALRAYSRYNELQKELSKESTQQKVEEMQKSMALEVKEKELLEKDLALMKSEKEQQKKNNLILVFSIGTLLLIGFLVYIFKINNKLKDVNKVISEQKSIIQEKHKDITDSIQYAQRIQESIILSDKVLESKVKDIFVLFQPRDIVSGDFYWYAEKNNLKLLAVADCTGHGVPGAFMSMIGITMLNQIVNEKGITSPAEILNRLRDGVIASLNQTKDETGKRDGMDVALIAWTDYSLVYAGANNPCLILRDNEFIELKPDKQPVGLYEKQDPFNEQKIFLQKNDQVFLFSDGLTDQFGGEKAKKVKIKGLKDWLVSLSDQSAKQKKEELEKRLSDWKGQLAQTDDILIIGFKC